MANSNEIRKGMQVYGANNQPLGKVENMVGSSLIVNGQTITREMIARVEGDRIYLTDAANEIRVSLAEEELSVGKREVEAGAVRVHKAVTQEQVSVPVELRREEAHIEKVDTPDRPLRAGEAAFQEQTFEVQLKAEEAVVQKTAVVTGEVVIDKTQQVEKRQISDSVRKERVEVEQMETEVETAPTRITDQTQTKRK